MNIYKIEARIYDESLMDEAHMDEYLTHEEKYEELNFSMRCSEAYEKAEDKCLYDVTQILIDDYGFERLKPLHIYEFREGE